MKNIAIITGASSGLGREFAMQIASKMKVDQLWLIARTKSKLLDTAKKVYEVTAVPSLVMPFDLLKEESFERIKNRLEKSDVNVKVLVNASGYGVSGYVGQMDAKAQSGMIDLNCKALFNMTYLCIPYMSRGSHIIQIASAASYVPQPKFAVYGASKSFVLSFSVALYHELKRYGIGVSAVCPGPVDTNFFHANKENNASFTKIGRILYKKPDFVVKKSLKAGLKNKPIINPGLSIKLLYLATSGYKKVIFAFLSKALYKR